MRVELTQLLWREINSLADLSAGAFSQIRNRILISDLFLIRLYTVKNVYIEKIYFLSICRFHLE